MQTTMHLKWFRVREFQSVKDSGQINLGDIGCLVGKNEAGKSTLLKALYKLRPIIDADKEFNVTRDYPRMDVEDYRLAVESQKRAPAIPIEACFNLGSSEIAEIQELFGTDCLKVPELNLKKSYENKVTYGLGVDENKSLEYLIANAGFSENVKDVVKSCARTAEALLAALAKQEQTEEVKRVLPILQTIKEKGVSGFIYENILKAAQPQFLYFDEYYQLTGHENIEALIQREASKVLKESDYPMLGLISLARLKLPELINPARTIELKNKLEGASNYLTKQVLKYWSQNKHLRMTFDVRPARSGDPAGMQSGTNIWGGVEDTRHHVTTELGTRSRGFVWFFSFLAWYSDIKKSGKNVILLLDEPGLTLHAKAQADLLHYFEAELKPNHQLIYTTHSPFMIDPHHFERVRIVQDLGIDAPRDEVLEDSGTKVLTDVFDASADSLFPLQGALGYEIHQTLFVGPNSLIVEGVADLLYLQAMSAVLQEEGHSGLDARWTITPVGGASKVPTFVALLGAQETMTIATLIDIQSSDRQKIEALYKEKLLKKANVLTFADFTKTIEADIEDMFGTAFYIDLVNAEFASQLTAPINPSKLNSKVPRVLAALEQHFVSAPLKKGQFNHYRPARYFNENIGKLKDKIPTDAKKRFAAAFDSVNAVLKTESVGAKAA